MTKVLEDRDLCSSISTNINNLDFLLHCLDDSYEGILLADLEGRVFYANKAVERVSGVPLKDIIGYTAKEIEERGIIVNQSLKVLKKNPLIIFQKLRTGKEVFITSKPVRDEHGNPICYVANYRDLSSLNELYERYHTQLDVDYSELHELRTKLLQSDNLIGISYQMKKLKEKVQKVAKSEAAVLIIGESGVGKEVVSKSIHKMSHRSKESYIQINCGAIPESLMEAELFGYDKGAFTGANSGKAGLLEVANKGTVLLDEIGEMPLHLQVKLLRVIQSKEITRVGGTKPKKLDIRFLAATNKDLKQMVEEGTFREDLYYRLNVVPIHIPPLRDRKEDIIYLSYYFLEKSNKKYGTHKQLNAETCKLLENYDWPGNIRQLENTIERIVIMTDTSLITAQSLPEEIVNSKIMIDTHKKIIPLKDLVKKTEKEMIEFALKKYKSIREAAKKLEVDHSTLVRKIKKLGIE